MHLFALLLTTVFSSQFVEPNTAVLTGVAPPAVSATEFTTTLPGLTFTTTALTTETLVWKLSLTPDASADSDTISPTDAGGGTSWTLAAFPLVNVKAKGIPTKFYVVLTVNSGAPESKEITVTPAFTATPAVVFEHQTKADIAIELYGAGWTDADDIYYAVLPTAPNLAAAVAAADITGNEAADAALKMSVTIPLADIDDLLDDIVDGHFYIYAGVANLAAAAANAPVPVAYRAPTFEPDKKTLPYSIVRTPANVVITLTETGASPTWMDGDTVNIMFAKAANGAAAITVTPAAEVEEDGVVTFTITAANLGSLAFTSQADILYIWASKDDNPITAMTAPFLITFDKFEVTPKEVDEVAITLADVKVIPGASAWTTTDKIKAKFSLTKLAHPYTGGFGEPAEGISYSTDHYPYGALNLQGQAIEGGKLIYVYTALQSTTTPYTYEMQPAVITVKKTTFGLTLDPTTLKDTATNITGVIDLSKAITGSLHTAAPDEIDVYVSLDPAILPSALTSIGKATLKATTTTEYEFTDLPLTSGMKLRKDKPLLVYVSFLKKDAATGTKTYLSHKVEVTPVEDDTVVRFTVNPPTLTETEVGVLDKVTITQSVGQPWTGPIKVQATLEDATGTAPVSGALTADQNGVYTWTFDSAAATYIQAGKATKKLTFKVDSKNDGTYLVKGVEITIGGAAPAESTFTLATTQLPWADPLKTTKIQITPLPAATHGWPTAANKVKIQFAIPAAPASNTDPDPVSFWAEIDATTAGSEKWYIPADQVLTTLVPTEPTADVTLEVTVSIDGALNYLKHKVNFTIKKPGGGEDAALGVSPLVSLLAALVFLFVKLF